MYLITVGSDPNHPELNINVEKTDLDKTVRLILEYWPSTQIKIWKESDLEIKTSVEGADLFI